MNKQFNKDNNKYLSDVQETIDTYISKNDRHDLGFENWIYWRDITIEENWNWNKHVIERLNNSTGDLWGEFDV